MSDVVPFAPAPRQETDAEILAKAACRFTAAAGVHSCDCGGDRPCIAYALFGATAEAQAQALRSRRRLAAW